MQESHTQISISFLSQPQNIFLQLDIEISSYSNSKFAVENTCTC